MDYISNGRAQKLSHSRRLCNYRELLICALEVNSPQTNTLPPHVVHKNTIECPPAPRCIGVGIKQTFKTTPK